ncbi:MAG: gamma-glutamyltransferase [Candidatus Neomarinimicrobiota bacterium]
MNVNKSFIFHLVFIVLLGLLGGCSQKKGNRGVVVSVHPIASQIGLEVLKEGGNAVDAAVATGLALGVVNQFSSGIGGGGFMVIRTVDGTIYAVDGREKAPAAATRDMYVEDGEVNTALSRNGPLAVAVPGILAAYEKALELAGTQPLSELIRPSVQVAENGFLLDTSYVSHYRGTIEELRKDPASSATYFHPDGSPLKEGDIFNQRDLAETYRRIGEEGTDYFYRGDFARKLAAYMAENGGLLTFSDMASYEAVAREPVISRYRNFEIIGMGPPNSGGVHLAQLLNMTEISGILDGRSPWDEKSIFFVSRFMAKAFEDRAEHLGDIDFYPVPIAQLTSRSYADSVVSEIMVQEQLAGGHLVGSLEAGHTTNFCVIDPWGNAVAVNQTVNLTYGAKVTVPGTGVVLNCEMDDFSARPGVPNYFGLLGSEANAIEPGKRPLSSMSPTIVVNGDRPVMILGGAGGPRIITAILQVMINYLDFKMSLAQALGHPRFHHQFIPETLFMEEMMVHPFREGQEQRGQKVALRKSLGRIQAIAWSEEEKEYVGVSDPRSGNGSVAYIR